MNLFSFELAGHALNARADRSLYWPVREALIVSDLHLGKSERIARKSGALLPPYETRETLWRLEEAIDATQPKTVICLGDSFDDLDAAQSLSEEERLQLTRLQAGREWIWVEGNHDPGPVELGGTHRETLTMNSLHFRHIATQETPEISGHYHPKLSLRGAYSARACFLLDATRVILPAFGAYTGGLHVNAQPLASLMKPDALAVLTGVRALAVPLSQAAARR